MHMHIYLISITQIILPYVYIYVRVGVCMYVCMYLDLKFGDGDGPNLCRVNKVDVSSTFIENIFRSGLTLVSS